MKHDIVITYCKPCGYEDRARRAAALIRERSGLTSELVPGKGGIFEVAVAGKLVAKRTKLHFPSDAEIADAVEKALGAGKSR